MFYLSQENIFSGFIQEIQQQLAGYFFYHINDAGKILKTQNGIVYFEISSENACLDFSQCVDCSQIGTNLMLNIHYSGEEVVMSFYDRRSKELIFSSSIPDKTLEKSLKKQFQMLHGIYSLYAKLM